ncbi:uncharacterized protein Eint_040670 [Encephalitozoon intestinalis ATCC 50506]|uniref:Integral membrane protein n=1 Tax=Encephalitozoon intestinalis (strain ATCC 50506) TaxID=876142 RepID=E0S6M2_ENCIT|nr:uncharacterized protein Eint_040670 [Encephalitozoon intestinalis ATCC 50506]ADM11357.1 hypothetical protein Eint_040670 [Encephalitozoon intestinalis ATCC 50506]UTX45047.1 hypothetical protein GPK93_04g05840 [Encephalitozoon intestinalis]
MNSKMFLVVIIFWIFQVVEVGVIDALEHAFVNAKVYQVHNFPDILGMDYNKDIRYINFYAFLSGVICTWILVFPLTIKLVILAVFGTEDDSEKVGDYFLWFHLALLLLLTFADILILWTCDRDTLRAQATDAYGLYYIYRNHKLFYLSHLVAEIVSLVGVVFYGCLFKDIYLAG